MSELESIEKLREWSRLGPMVCQDLLDIADEIEREVAERYMERPCDMDGVPIKIGDELSHDGFARNFIVHSYELVDGAWAVWDVANGATHICSACRHVKSRTVEDVLRDCCNEWNEHLGDDWEAGVYAKYAYELREMAKEGEL